MSLDLAGAVLLAGVDENGNTVLLKLNSDGTLSGAGGGGDLTAKYLIDGAPPADLPNAIQAAAVAKSGLYSDLTGGPASDPAAGTAGLRTLGTGALQAASGADSRLSNARTPTAHGSTHLAGGSDPTSPLTTKGDLWGYSTLDARVPIGSNGKVLTADSAAALGVSWQALAVVDYINLRDQKAQNTAGGTATSGAWRTRDLNTKAIDTGSICTLSGNQFTLPVGTYRIKVSAPAYHVDRHQARLQNITDATTTLVGTSELSLSGGYATTRSFIEGEFTIATSKTFEVQHQVQTTDATQGFGAEANFTTEVYTIVEIWRV